MTEQDNKPEMTDEELQEVARSVPAPDEYPEGQAEDLQARVEELDDGPNGLEQASVAALEATKDAEEAAPVQAFDQAVTAIEEAIETVGAVPTTPEEAHADAHHGDTTVIFGREYPVPVYTAVFATLGLLTVIEVLIAEIISAEVIKIPLLLGIAVAKAGLVVIFYMHLNTDSRIFALTLAVPVGLALLSVFYLLGVNPTGY